MGLEGATYISDLVVTNPVNATDSVSAGDDHLRLIKSVLKTTFPNANAAITPTVAEFNRLIGVTADIELMRGMAWTTQALPYSVAAGDVGTAVDLSNAGTLTLGAIANNFACSFVAVGGAVTVTSSSGTLSWMSAGGVAMPTGNRTVARGSMFSVFRVGGNWRIVGGGIT
jgi:hypothetical protein